MAGTKRKRGSDSWRLEVTIGTDAKGKPKRYSKTVHCKSEKEAEKELARFYAECADGKVKRESAERMEGFCDTYYKEYAERFLKTSTLNSTRAAIKQWIKPRLGHKKVVKVTRLDVQQYVNGLSDAGLSPKTIRNYYTTLRQIMAYAVDMGLIDDTPCKNIRLPKKDHTEAKYYTLEDMQKLLAALSTVDEEHRAYKVAILILLFGGLRKGEVLGLNWEDVDYDTSTIHVHRTRMIAAGKGVYEDTPKTESSNRYVTLPAEIMAEIKSLQIFQKERRLMLGPRYEVTDAVLQGSFGGPLYPQHLPRWFGEFLKENDLPAIGLHGLRHTHASMLAHMNTDKMQISERLGHSELSTTLNIYTHLFENADRQIADDLSARFLSKTAK